MQDLRVFLANLLKPNTVGPEAPHLLANGVWSLVCTASGLSVLDSWSGTCVSVLKKLGIGVRSFIVGELISTLLLETKGQLSS
jgi:hypothetical protein